MRWNRLCKMRKVKIGLLKVALWFCYQTWPNLIRLLRYGCLCHAQIASSPQNKYHTLNTAGLDPQYTHTKNDSKQTGRAAKIPRPSLKSSWQEESKSVYIVYFCKTYFRPFFQNNIPDNSQTKIDHAELDSPRQMLLFRGLRPFWGVSLCLGIIFLVS